MLDHPSISQSYFFPTKINFDNPFWVDANGFRLSCIQKIVDPEADTVLMFHGNGALAVDYIDNYSLLFNHMGYNTFLAEYRGYGMSEGNPALVGMLDDVVPIVEQAQISPEKMIIFGRSVGSIYALETAKHFPQAKALILESGISSVFQRIRIRINPSDIGMTEEDFFEAFEEPFNHEKKLTDFQGKTLVLHTIQDELVGVEHGKQLFEWANDPKHVRLFEQGGHNSILFENQEAYLAELRKFLA